MNRVQAPEPSGYRAVQSRARPVDTFIAPPAPQAPETSDLTKLAGALSSLQPALARYQDRKDEAQIKADVAKAQADRLGNKLAFKDAVLAGHIPAGASPHYVNEWKRMDGELVASGRYRGDLSAAYTASGLGTKDFPTEADAAAAYQTFQEEFRAGFIKSTFGDGPVDPSWVEGFYGVSKGIEAAASTNNQAERIKTNEAAFGETFAVKVADALAADDAGAQIAALIKGGTEVGQHHTVGNKLAVHAITTEAKAFADAGDYYSARQTLAIADTVPTSPGNYLSGGSGRSALVAARASIDAAEQAAETLAHSRLTRSWALADRPFVEWGHREALKRSQRQDVTEGRADDAFSVSEKQDDARQQAIEMIATNPLADLQPLFEKWKVDKDLAPLIPQMTTTRQNLINAKIDVVPDLDAIAALKLNIARGGAGSKEIMEGVANRWIDKGSMTDLIDDYNRKQEYDKRESNLPRATKETFDFGFKAVKTTVAGGDEAAYSDELEEKVFEAQDYFRSQMFSFLDANPNATQGEIRAENRAIVDAIRSFYKDDNFKPGTTPGGNPYDKFKPKGTTP